MQLSRPTLLSVVVPLYNEENNLPKLFPALQELNSKDGSVKLELVLVDDGSKDATFKVAEELAAAHDNVTVVRMARNYGSHSAIAAGLSLANGDCALFIAGDMQDPPSLVVEMLEAWKEGFKIVWAARTTVEGKSRTSEFFSTLYWSFFNASVEHPVVEGGVDFALIDRDVLEILKAQCHLPEPVFAQITETGFAAKTIRYTKRERTAGKSGWTLKKKFGLVFQTLFCSPKIFRQLCVAAIIASLISFAFWLYVSIKSATTPELAVGYIIAVIISHSLMLLHFSLLFLLMEYLSLRLRVPNATPRFRIERIITSSSKSSQAGATP